MGKGKGKFARWLIILKSMVPVLVFLGFGGLKLIKFKNRIKYFFTTKPQVSISMPRQQCWADPRKVKFLNQPYTPKNN